MSTTSISASQQAALDTTIALLERIIEMIRLAPGEQWLVKFERDLEWARELRSGSPDHQELIDLSSSIMSVYGGMGSFSDWGPGIYDPATGRITTIPGTEDFDQVARHLYDAAFSLRDPKPIE